MPDATPQPADKPSALPLPRRRWYQFSLRAMFVWVAAMGVGLGLLLNYVLPVQRQRAAVNMIARFGVNPHYADPPSDESRLTTWLRNWLPRDYFDAVVAIDLSFASVTDADLQSLSGLTQLQTLYLFDTQVSDAGLKHLSGLTQLRKLNLDATLVTNAGLTHLRGLKQLRNLSLGNIRVGKAGVAELQQALPNCVIDDFY